MQLDFETVKHLNTRFLGLTSDGESRKNQLLDEIQKLSDKLMRAKIDYQNELSNKNVEVTKETLANLEESFPEVKDKRFLYTNSDGSGLTLAMYNIHNNITMDGDILIYQTHPIYSFEMNVPLAGRIVFRNKTNIENLTLPTYEGRVKYLDGDYSHPHSSANVKKFMDICTGTNRFLSNYENGYLNTSKNVLSFLIGAMRWITTTNIGDMYSSSMLYRGVSVPSFEVRDELLKRAILPAFKEAYREGPLAARDMLQATLTPGTIAEDMLLHLVDSPVWAEENPLTGTMFTKKILYLYILLSVQMRKAIQFHPRESWRKLYTNSIHNILMTDIVLSSALNNIHNIVGVTPHYYNELKHTQDALPESLLRNVPTLQGTDIYNTLKRVV